MASNEGNAKAVGFSTDGLCLELRDLDNLVRVILPRYFKQGNISSLTRQLNNYGFKTSPRQNESVTQCFSHPNFLRNRPDLCANIKRRIAQSNTPPVVEVEKKAKIIASTPLPPPTSSNEEAVVKPSYAQLVELNSLLQFQNQQLLLRVNLLEEALMNKRQPTPPQPQQPIPTASTTPMFPLFTGLLPPSTTSSLPPPTQPQPSSRNHAMRVSGEQAMSLFSSSNNIRSSGEMARSFFQFDLSSSSLFKNVEDADVSFKNLSLDSTRFSGANINDGDEIL